jgi:anti-sigma-K factor RskA
VVRGAIALKAIVRQWDSLRFADPPACAAPGVAAALTIPHRTAETIRRVHQPLPFWRAAMRAHILTIAAAMTLAAPAASEPAKTPVQDPRGTVEQPVVLMAAAADVPQVQQPQQPQQAPSAAAAAKPVRHARVTTCRCGDQNPSE